MCCYRAYSRGTPIPSASAPRSHLSSANGGPVSRNGPFALRTAPHSVDSSRAFADRKGTRVPKQTIRAGAAAEKKLRHAAPWSRRLCGWCVWWDCFLMLRKLSQLPHPPHPTPWNRVFVPFVNRHVGRGRRAALLRSRGWMRFAGRGSAGCCVPCSIPPWPPPHTVSSHAAQFAAPHPPTLAVASDCNLGHDLPHARCESTRSTANTRSPPTSREVCRCQQYPLYRQSPPNSNGPGGGHAKRTVCLYVSSLAGAPLQVCTHSA